MAIGETVLGAVLGVVLDKLSSPEVRKFFRHSKIDQSLFHKLKTLMLTAEKLLLDAEEKQLANRAVKEWLDELKHWFYRAEEVMGQIATKALRSSLKSSQETSSLGTKVCKSVPSFWSSYTFNRKITASITEVVSMLESMLAQKDALGLRELAAGGPPSRATTSVPEDSMVYGRDREREAILKLLLFEEAKTNRFGVVAIVGMGGVGKTTLAKMVFNDARVQEAFDLKAWVCVSDQFNIDRVTKSILESVTDQLCSGSPDLNFLQNKLRSELGNKKFLLVLDDVWDENYEHWQTLQAPFSAGANGSKIIVTTRNKRVASVMCTEHLFPLNCLSDDDGWSLFLRHAFELGNLLFDPCLEGIGRKIVQKCKGLPLAIKTLGAHLRSTCDSKHWEDILHSSLWDLPRDESNVIPALWLSYYHLPGHLKRCFCYCAIFPKDYKLDCKELVLLWTAENFVQPSDGNRRIEDEGHEYLHRLISRSFLEPVGESHVTMHDLMHDLAQGVSGNFLARRETETPSKCLERVRHFSYVADFFDTFLKFQSIDETKYLRSFVRVGWTTGYLTDKVSTVLRPNLSYLQVLSLSGYYNLRLLEVIECPKQLRYLDVSSTTIKHLPKWVSTLCNLQTLILSDCTDLERLPADMWRLTSLRHLDIRGATSVTHMPKQIGKLKDLQTLTDFVVGNDIGSSIQELRELKEIRGKFAIRQLQNVADPSDARAVDLSNRKFIDDLELEFDDNIVHEECIEVLESLKPCLDVKSLTIRGYGGATLPKWLSRRCTNYKEIKFLCLSNCLYCSSLPPLGQLSSLKELTIEGMDCIQQVGHEFYGHDISGPFPSLESLTFESMKGWEVWSNIDAVGGAVCFPRLKRLRLTDCPNLKGNLPVHVPSLVKLEITWCMLLRQSLPRVPSAHVPVRLWATCLCPYAELPKALDVISITKLSLVGLLCLVKFPAELVMISSLSDLLIHDCGNLKSLADVQLPSSLKSVDIYHCNMLESLPEGVKLQPRLQNLRLRDCHRLICIPGSSLPTSLISLTVQNCDRWEFPISMERMQHYAALEELCLGHTSKRLVCFPLGIFPNLRFLQFWDSEGLEKVYIPERIEDNNLVSLSELYISSCDALEMIGKETGRGEATTELPALNLTSLSIIRCEKVKPVVIEREGEVLLPKLTRLVIRNSNSEKIRGESALSLKRSSPKFSCLTCLTIEGLEVECFPVAGEGLPTSLTELHIRHFPKLRKLDGEALHHLKYLIELDISDCPELERLPEEGLPLSLGSLRIFKYPKVEKRCQPPKGKDWSKIHHIPLIYIHKVWHNQYTQGME